MKAINPIGLAQEQQKIRDEKREKISAHRFEEINNRLLKLENEIFKTEIVEDEKVTEEN